MSVSPSFAPALTTSRRSGASIPIPVSSRSSHPQYDEEVSDPETDRIAHSFGSNPMGSVGSDVVSYIHSPIVKKEAAVASPVSSPPSSLPGHFMSHGSFTQQLHAAANGTPPSFAQQEAFAANRFSRSVDSSVSFGSRTDWSTQPMAVPSMHHGSSTRGGNALSQSLHGASSPAGSDIWGPGQPVASDWNSGSQTLQTSLVSLHDDGFSFTYCVESLANRALHRQGAQKRVLLSKFSNTAIVCMP